MEYSKLMEFMQGLTIKYTLFVLVLFVNSCSLKKASQKDYGFDQDRFMKMVSFYDSLNNLKLHVDLSSLDKVKVQYALDSFTKNSIQNYGAPKKNLHGTDSILSETFIRYRSPCRPLDLFMLLDTISYENYVLQPYFYGELDSICSIIKLNLSKSKFIQRINHNSQTKIVCNYSAESCHIGALKLNYADNAKTDALIQELYRIFYMLPRLNYKVCKASKQEMKLKTKIRPWKENIEIVIGKGQIIINRL